MFIPVGAETLREALTDPATVTRSVPGFQQDAGDAPGTGRFRLRAGGTTITYRAALSTDPGPEGVTLRAEGTEARGTGAGRVTVAVALTPAEEAGGSGTRAALTVTATGDGRAADLAADALEAAAVRLLNRFAETLATALAPPDPTRPAPRPDGDPADPDPSEDPPVDRAGDAAGDADDDVANAEAVSHAVDGDTMAEDVPDAEAVTEETVTGETAAGDATEEPEAAGDVPDAEAVADDVTTDDVTADGSTAADAVADDVVTEATDADAVADLVAEEVVLPDEGDEVDGVDAVVEVDDHPARADTPPAEAAHARRTMIGRSAEEVDHAPPRGRYAPVPAPEGTAQGATLRWAAPAAALVVATVIVVGRALRRRR